MPTAIAEETLTPESSTAVPAGANLVELWETFVTGGQELTAAASRKTGLAVLRSNKTVQTTVLSQNPRLAAALTHPAEIIDMIRAHITRESGEEITTRFDATDANVRMARNCFKWGYEYPYWTLESHTWNLRQGHHRSVVTFKKDGHQGTTTHFARLGGVGGLEILFHPDAKIPAIGRHMRTFTPTELKATAVNSPLKHFNPGNCLPSAIIPGKGSDAQLYVPYMLSKVEKETVSGLIKEIRPGVYMMAKPSMFNIPSLSPNFWEHIIYGTRNTNNTLTRVAAVLLQVAQAEEKFLGQVVEKLHERLAKADMQLFHDAQRSGGFSNPQKNWHYLTAESPDTLRHQAVTARLQRNIQYTLFPWLRLVADPFLPWNRNDLGAIIKFGGSKTSFTDNLNTAKAALQSLLDEPSQTL